MSNYSSWVIPTSIIGLLWRCLCKVPTIASMLLVLSGASSAWAADFDIDRARYSVDRDRLTIRGDSEDDANVRLYDDDSNVLFATVSADSDGNWSYRKNDPQAIPCRVRAESEDKSDERNVSNASEFPGGCGIDDGGGTPPPPPTGPVSINSTSQNTTDVGIAPNGSPVPEQPFVGNNSHRVMAINDLGMHCGDFDTRIASILPPFQVLLAQVVQKGSTPRLLDNTQAEVVYSAVSNPDDPILLNPNVFTGVAPDGSVYKTNFWDTVASGAYDPFYPPQVTPLAGAVTVDKGLPVPNVELLYIGPDGIPGTADHATGKDNTLPWVDRGTLHAT